MSAYKKEKLQYANKHIAVRKNYNFPYVGIIQIRLWVKAIQLTLSLFTQAPLVLIFLNCSTMTRRSQEKGSAVTVFCNCGTWIEFNASERFSGLTEAHIIGFESGTPLLSVELFVCHNPDLILFV